VSVREKEDSQGGSDDSWVEVSRESADDNAVGSVGSADSSPWGSEFSLVCVLCSGDLANSLSKVPLGSSGVVDSLDLDQSLVGVLRVSGSGN